MNLSLLPERLLPEPGGSDPVYGQEGGALVVNRYVASVLHWAEQGLRLRQLTQFPNHDATRLLVQEAPRTRLAIRLRHPSWCQQATVKLNGRRHSQSLQPGGFIEIERRWRRGDEIVLQLPRTKEPSP